MNYNNYLILGAVGFTGLCVIGGFLLGFLRGSKRSFTRFILIVGCVVAAWVFRGTATNYIKTMNIQGQTIDGIISTAIGGVGLPASIVTIITSLVVVILNVIAFILIFLVLQFVSFIIIFPILKLIVRKGKHAKRLLGAIIGIIQGAIVAYVVLVPAVGLLVQVNKIGSIELQENKKILQLGPQFNVEEFMASTPGQIYNKIGAPAFLYMTKGIVVGEDEISLDSVTTSAVAVYKVSQEISAISKIDLSGGVTSENLEAITESLDKLDGIVGELDDDSKKLINTMLTDAAKSLSGDDSVVIPEDLNLDTVDFGAASDSIKAINTYNEKEETGEAMSSEEADAIVSGLTSNAAMVEVLGDSSMLTIREEDKATLQASLDAKTEDPDLKAKISALLGLTETVTVPEE